MAKYVHRSGFVEAERTKNGTYIINGSTYMTEQQFNQEFIEFPTKPGPIADKNGEWEKSCGEYCCHNEVVDFKELAYNWQRGEALYTWYCPKCGNQLLATEPPSECPECNTLLGRKNVK